MFTRPSFLAQTKRRSVFLLVFLFVLTPVFPAFAIEGSPDLPPQETIEVPKDSPKDSEQVTDPSELPPEDDSEKTPPEGPPSEHEGEEPIPAALAVVTPAALSTNLTPSTIKQLLPYADGTTGALLYAYPIVIPPGRDGLQPDVKLLYNNQDASDASLLGYGWSLSTPSIERLNKTGIQNLYASNIFSSSLDGELVSVSSTSYRAKVDRGAFFEYTLSGNTWTVRDKKGTIYTFGNAAGSRQDNPSDPSQVFKWMISEIRDRNDNFISFSYDKSNGQIYPSTITYTGHGTAPGIFQVSFIRGARPDVTTSYRTAFPVTTNERVTEIKTFVNGLLTRAYAIGYATGDNGMRSLLSSVTETGYDASGVPTMLPATTIAYETATPGWTLNPAWSVPANFAYANANCNPQGVRTADVNGDGLQDLVKSVVDGANNYTQAVYLNTGSGWAATSLWTLPAVPFAHTNCFDYGTQVLDINGDALADILYYRVTFYPSSNPSDHQVYLNTGSGWAQNFTWTIPYPLTFSASDFGTRFADVNGDGLVDVLWSRMTGNDPLLGPVYDRGVAFNNGSNWVVDPTWVVPTHFVNLNVVGGINGAEVVDVNNDGLPDIVEANNTWSFSPSVYLNTGAGWALSSWVFPVPIRSGSVQADYGTRFGDLNGDGLVDVFYAHFPDNSNICDQAVYINTGVGWVQDSSWTIPTCIVTAGYGYDLGVRFFDADANGLMDVVVGLQNASPVSNAVYLAGDDRSDRADQFTSSTGSTTTISYKTPQQYTSGPALLNPATPMVFDTVEQITRNDGLDTLSSTTYIREGGAYYFGGPTDRKFAGFHIETATDASGAYAKTYYHQGNTTNTSLGEYPDHISKVGSAYRTEQYGATSNLFSTIVNGWDRADLGNGASLVKLAQTLRFDYDGNATHRDRAVSYAYNNANGNLTGQTEWGEVNGNSNGTFADTGSDKRVTSVTYANNAAYHILDLPSVELVTDQAGAKVRETKSYYDGLPLGSVTFGNPTKEERWKTGTSYIDVDRTYNAYGFMTQELDPLNHATNYTPDAYNLYPASTTNALGHTTSFLYDYSSGKPTQTIDPNGKVFQTIYDGLDRPIEEKQPNPSTPSTLETKATYSYAPQTIGMRTLKSDYLGASTSRDTYSYTDGFDRPIQTRVEAESSNTFAVSDTIYDTREYLWKQSLPYFSSSTARTSATTSSPLLSVFTYDALGRITNINTAVGNTTTSYDQWISTVTDPRSKVKTFTRDAYDRLTTVVENNASSAYTTSYAYNGRGDLTNLTDALGNTRSFTYDGLSRRLTAQDLHAPTDATFGTWTYTYDDAGNLSSSLNPKNQTIQYTYDNLNRQLTENFTGLIGVEVTNTYDSCSNGIGRLCAVTKTGLSESRTYDPLGRISTQTRTIESTPYLTSFTYDRQGNQLTITNPDSSQGQYVYNGAGLLNQVNRKESATTFTPVVSNIDYAPTGKRTVVVYANGKTTTNAYDANELYRLRTKVTSPGNLQNLTYTYDPNGNIAQIVDTSSTLSTKTTTYAYDDLNRLLSATVTGAASGGNGTQSYTYNAIGNLSTRSDVGSYAYTGNVGTNYANPHAATSAGGATFTYDNNGNLATSVVQTTTTTTPPTTPPWYAATPGAWAKRLPLTIQQSQVNGTTALANFPVLVSRTNTNLRSTANGGYVANASGNDILFTSSDGVTKLDHEIEKYNPATGELIAWVRIPSLSATVNTTVYLYFGNASAANQQNATGVWETNYKGVWHLDENPTTSGASITDSTSNLYNGTPYGSMLASASVVAKVGQGLTFDGTDDNLHLGTSPAIGNLTNNFTVSVWVRPTSLSGARRIIAARRLTTNNGFGFGTNGYNPRLSTFGVKEYSITSALTLNSWQRLDVVLANNNATYYRNGVVLGTIAHTTGGLANTDDTLRIGATSAVGGSSAIELFAGTMDELRVYSGVRTTDWIQAEYNNQNAQTSFVTFGTIQSAPVPVTTTINVTTTYTWDYNNRLSSITSPSLSASFLYDAGGTRVKSVLGGIITKTPTTWYSYVGTTPTKHILLPDGEMLATIEGSNASATPSYIHTDHLTGSAVVTNASGSQTQLLDYYPFGTIRLSNQSYSFNEKRKFAGHEYDAETGLSYMQARYYHPGTGRFLSEDPAFLAVGIGDLRLFTGLELQDYLSNPQALNSYSYTVNNPLKYVDETGEFFGEPGRGLASSQRDIANFLNQAADYTSNKGGFLNRLSGFVVRAEADTVNNIANVFDPDQRGLTRMTSLGFVALDVGTGGEGKASAQFVKQFGRSLTVDAAKQSRHIIGEGYLAGRSVLTHTDPQKLINVFAGTGQRIFNQGLLQKEIIDFGQTIGKFIDHTTGKAMETTRGAIHFGKSGTHLVPIKPNSLLK